MKQQFLKVAAVTGPLVAIASNAHATAMLDLTAANTAITAELTPALSSAMPIAGTLLAIGIAWKLYKRFAK